MDDGIIGYCRYCIHSEKRLSKKRYSNMRHTVYFCLNENSNEFGQIVFGVFKKKCWEEGVNLGGSHKVKTTRNDS